MFWFFLGQNANDMLKYVNYFHVFFVFGSANAYFIESAVCSTPTVDRGIKCVKLNSLGAEIYINLSSKTLHSITSTECIQNSLYAKVDIYPNIL